MLTIVLADAELETVPPHLHDHPQVSKPAQRKGKDVETVLLDSNVHHHAMQDGELEDHRRRGRPDLAHLFLVTALESTLNLEGGLETLIHTRNHEEIRVDPATRIMRAYPRFKGLVETLFQEGAVGPADRDPLLELTRRRPLPAILKERDPDHVIALAPEGEPTEPTDRIPYLAGEHDDVTVILGGFPRGDYESPISDLADETWSIHEERLTVWTAASEVLVPWRRLTKGISAHRGTPPER